MKNVHKLPLSHNLPSPLLLPKLEELHFVDREVNAAPWQQVLRKKGAWGVKEFSSIREKCSWRCEESGQEEKKDFTSEAVGYGVPPL